MLFMGISGTKSLAQCPSCASDAGTSGCTITLSGAVSNPTYTLNNSTDKLCIASGATITGTWNINITDPDAMIVNNGTINVSNGITINDGTFINNGELSLAGSLVINDGQMVNQNVTVVGGDLDLANSTAEICNQDSMNIANDVDLSGDFLNNGTIIVNNDFVQVMGNLCVTGIGKVYTNNDFTTNGNLRGPNPGDGCAYFEIGQISTVNSTGVLTGNVDFCDQTPPLTTPFIDSYSGSIDTNVTYCGCLSLLPVQSEVLDFGVSLHKSSYNLSANLLLGEGSYRLSLLGSLEGQTFSHILTENLVQNLAEYRSWKRTFSAEELFGYQWIKLALRSSDGNRVYSSPLRLAGNYPKDNFRLWQNTPRSLKIQSSYQGKLKVKLMNMQGQWITERDISLEGIPTELALPENISPGVYQVFLQTPQFRRPYRIWLR